MKRKNKILFYSTPTSKDNIFWKFFIEGKEEKKMNKEEATRILGDTIRPDNSLYDLSCYINWDIGDEKATLDGIFNAEELEAIAWWMRNIKEGEENGK